MKISAREKLRRQEQRERQWRKDHPKLVQQLDAFNERLRREEERRMREQA